MPIDLLSSSKKVSQFAFSSPFLNKILGSSLFTAGIVSFLMVMLIMVMYPAKSGTSFSIVVKMFIYMFFGSLLVIFLHDSVVRFMMEEEYNEKQSEAFMQNITQTGRVADPSYAALYKPIVPATGTVPTPATSTTQTPAATSTTGAAESTDANIEADITLDALPTTFVPSDTVVYGGKPPAKWMPRPQTQNPYK